MVLSDYETIVAVRIQREQYREALGQLAAVVSGQAVHLLSINQSSDAGFEELSTMLVVPGLLWAVAFATESDSPEVTLRRNTNNTRDEQTE